MVDQHGVFGGNAVARAQVDRLCIGVALQVHSVRNGMHQHLAHTGRDELVPVAVGYGDDAVAGVGKVHLQPLEPPPGCVAEVGHLLRDTFELDVVLDHQAAAAE